MPQSSYYYAISHIGSISHKIVDAPSWNKLLQTKKEELLKVLTEMGYGNGGKNEDKSESKLEDLIANEIEYTRNVIADITPDQPLTDLFLLSADIHNIKVLIKSRMLQKSEGDEPIDPKSELFAKGGIYSIEKLQEYTQTKKYSDLPQDICQKLDIIEKSILQKKDSAFVSNELDKAYFKHVMFQCAKIKQNSKNVFVKDYFQTQATLLNLRSVIRARMLGWDEEKLVQVLVDCNDFSQKELLQCVDIAQEQLSKKLAFGNHSAIVSKAIENYVSTNNANEIEQLIDTLLVKIVQDAKNIAFSLAPIVGFLVAKNAEAKALRVLFAAKSIGVEPVLPKLYN